MNITKTESIAIEITSKVKANLKKLAAVNIDDCEDEFEIEIRFMEADLQDVLNDTYKLIKELCNFNKMYSYDDPCYDEIEVCGHLVMDSFDEYDFVDCLDVLKDF